MNKASHDAVRMELVALEQTRCVAQAARDIALLDNIYREDITYIHADGFMESKQDLLASIKSGPHKVPTRGKLSVRLYDNAAVMTGDLYLSIDGQPEVSFVCTQVWTKDSDNWCLAAFQGSRRSE